MSKKRFSPQRRAGLRRKSVVGAREDGRLAANGIIAKYGVDADVVYAEPVGMVRLAHITYQLTSKAQQHLVRSVDYFVDTVTGLSGILATTYPVDAVLEAKAGVKYTIPQQFAYATGLIRGIAAAHIRAHLGDRLGNAPVKSISKSTSREAAAQRSPPTGTPSRASVAATAIGIRTRPALT
jgi:hypothetical protein